jgi:hypothetical protein
MARKPRPSARERINTAALDHGWEIAAEQYGAFALHPMYVRYRKADVVVEAWFTHAGGVSLASICTGNGVVFAPRQRKADEVLDVLLRQQETED